MGTARQLERAEAAAAFNPGWRVGRGSAGCDPSHWKGDPPSSAGRGGASAAPPAPATLGAADAGCRAGIRVQREAGQLPTPQPECVGGLRATSPRRAPRGGAGPGWAAGCLAPLPRARPGYCPPLPPPRVRRGPGHCSCEEGEGFRRTTSGFMALPGSTWCSFKSLPSWALQLLKTWAHHTPTPIKTPRPRSHQVPGLSVTHSTGPMEAM